ncbi:MAG: hypothetical protein PHH01_04235 [Patescibacteria group bacterium]|nr:hypothetical protein [Patescibacteria group bacterium]
MSFDPTACGRALQGVDPDTMEKLRLSASALAEQQAEIFGAPFRQKPELVRQARPHLLALSAGLELARSQSGHPEGLPTKDMSEEERIAWATAFAWRNWHNGRDDG